MPLVSATCPKCGSVLEVDSDQEAAVCPACGTPYIVEKAINYYNTTNHITADVVNVFSGSAPDFVIRAGELVKYNGAATKVVIPNSVTKIGEKAFDTCGGLVSVTIPDGVTEIGKAAFLGCNSLVHISIPSSITIIGPSAFFGCSNLKEVVIPNGVQLICDMAFFDCGIVDIVIPASVTYIGRGAFAMFSLKNITIPDSVQLWSVSSYQSSSPFADEVYSDSTRYYPDLNIIASDSWKRRNWTCHPCLASYEPQQEHTSTQKTDNSTSGCFVATAVYGSYDCPEVWVLRRYRDKKLLNTILGRAFVKTYYFVSPKLVKLFGDKAWFNRYIRAWLDEIVTRLHDKGYSDSPYSDR